MKKCLALLLAMLMLFAVSAQAEDAYLRQIDQTRYVNTLYIPAESFPQVALAANYPELIYNSSYSPKQPLFACFGLPQNTIATSFDLNTCHLINEDENIQYSYQMMENYSYETLLNKCNNDAYIIFDGSEKKAAYLDPDRARAYGLVGVPEIAKGAKLYITVYLGGLGRNVPTEERVKKLTEVITAEVNRVQSEIHVQLMDPHWTSGRYVGLKMPSMEFNQLLVFDFPEVTMNGKEGTPITTRMFPVSLDGNRFKCYAVFDLYSGMEVKISMETYSYVNYQKEKSPKEVHSITLSNGVVFDVYAHGLLESEKSSSVYCCHVLANDAGYNKDQAYHLNIELDGNNVNWTSLEDVTATLESIVGNMYFVDPASDPYVPGAAPAAPAAPASNDNAVTDEKIGGAEKSNGWVCPECQNENSGNFCSNCGTKKPETKGPWNCPGCNTENNGNFCSNCGTKKP